MKSIERNRHAAQGRPRETRPMPKIVTGTELIVTHVRAGKSVTAILE